METSHTYACGWDICPELESLLWLMSPLKIGGGLAHLPQSCLQVLGPQATCVGEPGAVCEGQLPTWASPGPAWQPFNLDKLAISGTPISQR